MTTKLQRKLARQAKQTDRLMGNYLVGGKSGTSRNNGCYKFNFTDKIKA